MSAWSPLQCSELPVGRHIYNLRLSRNFTTRLGTSCLMRMPQRWEIIPASSSVPKQVSQLKRVISTVQRFSEFQKILSTVHVKVLFISGPVNLGAL